MASKDESHPSKQEPRLGGRIDIVEDEDFSLLLDIEPAAPASTAAAPVAPSKPEKPATAAASPLPVLDQVIDLPDPSTDRTSRLDVLAEPAPELLMPGASVREVPAAEAAAAVNNAARLETANAPRKEDVPD